VLQETLPDQSTEQIPASIGSPHEKRCDTIPRTPNTHMHETSEPTLKMDLTRKGECVHAKQQKPTSPTVGVLQCLLQTTHDVLISFDAHDAYLTRVSMDDACSSHSFAINHSAPGMFHGSATPPSPLDLPSSVNISVIANFAESLGACSQMFT
jgi:hypothetical protein